MLLPAKKCVRCGLRFTAIHDVHAEYKEKDKRAVNGYVTWCGDCYPIKHEPIPEGQMPSPRGLIPVPDGYEWTAAKGLVNVATGEVVKNGIIQKSVEEPEPKVKK